MPVQPFNRTNEAVHVTLYRIPVTIRGNRVLRWAALLAEQPGSLNGVPVLGTNGQQHLWPSLTAAVDELHDTGYPEHTFCRAYTAGYDGRDGYARLAAEAPAA